MSAPSNDVLKNMIDNIEKKLDEHAKVHETIVNLIKELQEEMRLSNGWKNKFLGAMIVVTVVVVPIMSWVLWEVVNLDSRIDDALANYEFEITQ